MYRAGLAELDTQIVAARAAMTRDEYLARIATAAAADAERIDGERIAHEKILAGEQKDVDRLEGFSLRGLFWSILGKKEEKLQAEREELLAATLKHGLVQSELASLQAQLGELERQRAELAGASDEIARLLGEKERWLQEHGGPAGESLFKMSEQAGRYQELSRELDEAIAHGNEALVLIDLVLDSLKSAGNWGTFDMFGGGLLATAMKHGKIDTAKKQLEEAQGALLRFQHELEDVELQLDAAEIDMSGFSKFGDYFFDGLIFDWSVQSKIKRSREAVEQTRAQLVESMDTLAGQKADVAKKMTDLAAQRTALIEGFGK